MRGVGGTRNCDWWFTDEAVLLDTAGRYTTQDSDESADSAGWGEFLSLLTKYRKRRPLNGVIVTLSASDLMTHTAQEREANVAAVRRRLDELNRHLKVRLPVYLLVTKCDLISGFTEYFDDLGAEGRAQVWGMTFSPERSAAGRRGTRILPAEFDALIERLNQRLFGRIEEERDTAAAHGDLRLPAADGGTAQFDRWVRDRGVCRDALRWPAAAARCLFHQRHAGRHADRPVDGRDRPWFCHGAGRRPAVCGRARQGVLHRTSPARRDVRQRRGSPASIDARTAQAALQLGAYAASLLIAVLGVIALSISYQQQQVLFGRCLEVAALVALNGLVAHAARSPWPISCPA